MRARESPILRTFSFWRIPGRKHLVHAGSELVIEVGSGPQRARASLSTELEDGSACAFALPLDAPLRTRFADYRALARTFEGDPTPSSCARPVTRAGLLHLRALQALDATQAGASQRDIVDALFGTEAARLHWHADGELRAQVRHLVSRADALMRGDYLHLAGVSREYASGQGDEYAH